MKNIHCDTCNTDIRYNNWSRHLKSKKHKSHSIQEVSSEYPVGIQKVSGEVSSKEDFKCELCNSVFTKKNNLYRHKKNRCPKVKCLKEEIERQRKELEIKEQQLINNTTYNNNTTNNTTTTNTNSHNTLNNTNNNIININIYGEEKHDMLDTEFLKQLSFHKDNMKLKMSSVLDKLYIENENNHNVEITNLNGKYCKVLTEQNKWDILPLDRVLNYRMYNSVSKIINDIHKNNLPNDVILSTIDGMTKYQKYISHNEKLNKVEKKCFKEIKEDHKLKLYNLKNKTE